MEHKTLEKSFFFGLLIITTVCALLVLQPFLLVIVVGASLAIVFNPLLKIFQKVFKERWLGALLTTILFVMLLTGPLFLLGTVLVRESQGLYSSLVREQGLDPLVLHMQTIVDKFFPLLGINVQEIGLNLAKYLSSNLDVIFTTTVNTVLALVFVIMSLFYFLKNGSEWKDVLIKFSPLSTTADEKIMNRLIHAVNGVMRGYLLIAFAQGVLMGIGLWIFGVPNPALWGTITGIVSLVPTLGTAFVAVPAVLYLAATGTLGQALGLLAWAVLLVGLIDNMLNPILVGNKVDIPAMLILFSVLGGLSLFGPAGILVGPLVISLLFALFDIYKTEYR
jgi:predicted PurR-regulated permease PerM